MVNREMCIVLFWALPVDSKSANTNQENKKSYTSNMLFFVVVKNVQKYT